MKIHIYQIWFPTSKKSYVGQTNNLERRMKQHFRSGSLVCKALYKYDDWQITIMHTTKNKNLANQLEIEDIRNLNCVSPNGYNLTSGGDGGDTFTNNPNKEKRREKIKGNKNLLGYHHTEETIRKMKGLKKPGTSSGLQRNKNAKGYKHTEEWKQKKSREMQRNNPMSCIDVKIKRLKRRIQEAEG